MPDYQTGQIYKILVHIDDDMFVGSACEALSQIITRHRSLSNRNNESLIYRHLNKLGIEQFYIEVIEDYPCEKNEQLVKRESEIVREIGTLNSIRFAQDIH